MSIYWAILVIYLIIGVLHFPALLRAGKSLGYRLTAPRVIFIGICSLFWPIMWLWFGFDYLRGRT